MDDGYRNDVRGLVREGRWSFFKILPTFVLVIAVVSGLGFAVRSATKVGDTAVERMVFENSYQRSESLKAQVATDTAVLAEIDRKLRNPQLDAGTRANLEAQASAARIRIQTAEGKW